MQDWKTRQKIESRERILNVASRLFKKNGYAATGIDQIMQEAGLTAGAFYAHFNSKTTLLEETIKHSLKNSRQQLMKDSGSIQTIFSKYVSRGHRDLADKGCILPALAAELHRGPPQVAQIIAHYLNAWADMIAGNFPAKETEKKEKALVLISQAVGAVLLARMVKSTELSDQIIAANSPTKVDV